jgi:hypothetical protein
MPNINARKFNQTYSKLNNLVSQAQTGGALTSEHFNVPGNLNEGQGNDLFNHTIGAGDKRSQTQLMSQNVLF